MRNELLNITTAACFSILAFASVPRAQVCQPAPVGLVSWYSGDGNALDSRSRNNATLLNGATFAAGESGQAFSFNGTSSFVQINNDSVLDFGTGDFSVELWFNLNTTSGNQTLFQKRLGNFPNTQEYLLESNNGNLRFLVRDTTTNENNLEVAGMITPNTWNHFAAVRQGNNSKIYFNGNLVGNQTTGTNINTGTGGTAVFGKLLDFDLRFVNGRIDEAALYNRALSASEILQIFNAGTAGKCKPTATTAPSGQVGWWAGDGNAKDTAGTNNGTLQNGAGFAVGKVGQQFNFDGTQSVDVPDNAALDFTNAFTMEMWINPSDVGTPSGTTAFISKGSLGNASSQSYAILFNSAGTIFNRVGNGSTIDQVGSTNNIPLNTYTHIATSYDGGTLRIYINGVLNNSQLTAVGTLLNSTDPLQIGRGTSFVQAGIDEVSLYNRSLTDAEIQSIFNAGIAGKLKDTTTIGTTASVGDVSVTYGTTATRTTQEIPLAASVLPALPVGMTSTGLFYDVATSAVTAGNAFLCFNLQAFAGLTPTEFHERRILHLEGGAWTDRTSAYVFASKTVCASSPTLSPFAIVDSNLAPSAAAVSVSGRVTTADGRGISRARVTLTDSDGSVRTAITTAFGFYRFEDVAAGESYVVGVQSKRFTFAVPSRILSIVDDMAEVDFTSNE